MFKLPIVICGICGEQVIVSQEKHRLLLESAAVLEEFGTPLARCGNCKASMEANISTN